MSQEQPYANPTMALRVLDQAQAALPKAPAFHALQTTAQDALTTRLDRVRNALAAQPQAFARPADPYDLDVLAHPMIGPSTGYGGYSNFGATPSNEAPSAEPSEPKSLLRTVNELPAAAGAMADELGFADFVASLVHGTFDAIVDSSIRQMEAFASLVSSLSQTVDEFSRGHVSTNQVRDWLVEQHPADLQLILPTATGEQPRVVPRAAPDDDWGVSPAWLSEYGLDGEDLSETLIETRVIPQARARIGEERMRTLASMALMGLNRVRVERGEISAKLRIRAKASDSARVGFAQDQDGAGAGGSTSWSGRAGFSAPAAQAMVSTSVNAQSDAAIAAELQGEVRIVFASETVPLESFVSDAQRVLLERTARTRQAAPAHTPARIAQDAVNAAVSPTPASPPEPTAASQPAPAPQAPLPQSPQAPDTGGPA